MRATPWAAAGHWRCAPGWKGRGRASKWPTAEPASPPSTCTASTTRSSDLNARDAMGSGGALEVRTWMEGARARIEVADSGTGIAPEHLHRVYDPFFRSEERRVGMEG